MSGPSEASRRLAQQLLAREAGENPSAEGLANSSTRLINRLYWHLSIYISEVGCTVLFARALYVAKQDYPWLSSTEIGSLGTDEPLPGLRAAMVGRDPSTVGECIVAILAIFSDLLTGFLGRDLAERLVNEAREVKGPGLSD